MNKSRSEGGGKTANGKEPEFNGLHCMGFKKCKILLRDAGNACLVPAQSRILFTSLRRGMKPSFIITGLALLLCASFFDSLRGPLLPLFSRDLGLPYDRVSLFLVAGYLSAMAFGRLLIP